MSLYFLPWRLKGNVHVKARPNHTTLFQKIVHRGHITYVKQPAACSSTVQLSWVEWVKGITQAYSSYNKLVCIHGKFGDANKTKSQRHQS